MGKRITDGRAVGDGSEPVLWNALFYVSFANCSNLFLSKVGFNAFNLGRSEGSASDEFVTAFGKWILEFVKSGQNRLHFSIHFGIVLLLVKSEVVQSKKSESLREWEFLNGGEDFLLVLDVFFFMWVGLDEISTKVRKDELIFCDICTFFLERSVVDSLIEA